MAISARTTAHKIAKAANARVKHEGTTRFQLSAKAVGDLSGRCVVDRAFVMELGSELMARGWVMFQVNDSSYGFLQLSSAQGFRKLSAASLLAFESKPALDAPAAPVNDGEEEAYQTDEEGE